MNNTQSDNNLFYFNRLTYITPHEVALAMNGFDYDTENDELTEIQLKEVIRLRKAITRNLQLINEYKNISATQKVEANLVLMNPLMILVKIIKLRWIHILSYDQ
ncbi:hypothetical protein MMA64_17145, partial [Salmonella enterica]|nr:hypothetical protein [Salmonella enterica]MCH5798620.1 hypothetical protein [Salmonella enterica]MCH5808332.1 hypothetical protein [Salmonella enterica]